MKKIKLRDDWRVGGKRVLVDDDDYEELMKHKWGIYKNEKENCIIILTYIQIGNTFYRKDIHIMIMGKKENRILEKNEQVEHINRDDLDNRKSNLRLYKD